MPTSLRELQSILEFDEADLVANRKGKLSKGQIEWFHAKAQQELRMLLAIPVLVVAWLMLTIPFVLAFPTVLLVGAMMAGFIALHKLHIKSISNHSVRKLSGQLRKNLDTPRIGMGAYVITVNNQPLPVDRYFFEQISEGKFTIYLYNDQILCMEPLRTASVATTAKGATAKSAKSSTKTLARTTTAKPKPKTTSAKPSKPTTSATSKTKSASSQTTSAKKPSAPKAEKPAKPTGKAPKQSLQRTRRAS